MVTAVKVIGNFKGDVLGHGIGGDTVVNGCAFTG